MRRRRGFGFGGCGCDSLLLLFDAAEVGRRRDDDALRSLAALSTLVGRIAAPSSLILSRTGAVAAAEDRCTKRGGGLRKR